MQYYSGNQSSSRRSRRTSSLHRLVLASKLTKYALFLLLGGIIFFFLYFLWISRNLPTPGKLANPDIHDSTKILDKNGVVLYSIYKDYNRIYIPLKEIPKSLQEATIATEDQDFYKNDGFSFWAYARVIKDILLRQRLTGGSTITQQLVKNVLLTSERSLTRKMKELILAVQVDKKFSKDEILEMYLNNVPYGGTAVGIEAAANQYFGKHAKDLNFSESVFLAGLPQSPSYYSPFSGNKAYIERTEHVLKRMKDEGIISQKEVDKALHDIKTVKFNQETGSFKAPHFVMYVKKKLIDLYGENTVMNGNLTVKTTLDYAVQKDAEKIVKEEIDKLKGYKVGNGSAVVLDAKNGAILAMVGSRDYFDEEKEGNFNTATARRQPGSVLKPVIYATAFEKGFTPATLLLDVETEFPTGEEEHPIYKPVNYDGKYRGPMQARFALANSMNLPSVKLLARVGIKSAMQKGYEMGIENWDPTPANMKNVGLSLVLGGREASLLEIASAYSVFADEGVKKEPFSIVEVKDGKGKKIYKHDQDRGTKALSKEVSFLISHILLDNNSREMIFGLRSWLVVPGHTVAAKTGTTDQKRDNWTVGYTPSFVVGVWVGNNDNSEMNPAIASGSTGATPIWNKIMQRVLKGKKNEEFKQPENVVSVEIDALGGGLPLDGQSKRTEYFIKGTEPSTKSPIYKQVKVSKKDSNRLANDEELSRNDYDLRDFIVFEEEDLVSDDGKNRWQEGIDAWLDKNYKDDPKYHPPRDKSDKTYDSQSSQSSESVQGEQITPTPTFTPSPTP